MKDNLRSSDDKRAFDVPVEALVVDVPLVDVASDAEAAAQARAAEEDFTLQRVRTMAAYLIGPGDHWLA